MIGTLRKRMVKLVKEGLGIVTDPGVSYAFSITELR